jgi:hypothetical protein
MLCLALSIVVEFPKKPNSTEKKKKKKKKKKNSKKKINGIP